MQLLVDTQDYSSVAQGLTWSNTDPGGFESLSFSVQTDQPFYRGTRVLLIDGLSVVWMGRVAEVTVDTRGEDATTNVSCQGYVAALKDNPYTMVYVDRDLSHWRGASVARRLILTAYQVTDPAVQFDTTASSGGPSLAQEITGGWTGGAVNDGWYDAGGGNVLSSIYYAWKINGNISSVDPAWSWAAQLNPDDTQTAAFDQTGNLRAAGPGSGTVTATAGDRRFAAVRLFFNSGPAGGEGITYGLYWTCLAVYGNHGLPKRGTADFTNAQGFYPSDISRHALAQGRGAVVPGVITDASAYIVPHSVYQTPTAPWDVIQEQAKLAGGWHTGVWEPFGAFSNQPRLDFRPPPTDATAVVARRECSDLAITQRLDNLYDTALVTYTDAAGAAATVTVSVPFPALSEAGLSPRTLNLDAGLSSAAGAKTLGTFALQLSQAASRGAGSATLPNKVSLPSGGYIPAYLLRSGIDRLRVLDLPNSGPVTEGDTRRRDTFRISRVESRVDPDGTVNTNVELDVGADLLEVLLARLSIENVLVGVG